MVGQEAGAGAGVHQEVLRRNGVPQEDEVTTREFSREWPQTTLERQPGTGGAAVAGGGAKPCVIITNIRRWRRRRRLRR